MNIEMSFIYAKFDADLINISNVTTIKGGPAFLAYLVDFK